MPFQSCSSCHRFVRPRERSCPFCQTALSSGFAPLPLVVGLLAGLALAGCDDKDSDSNSSGTPSTATATTGGTTGGSSSSEGGGATTNPGGGASDGGGADYAGPPNPDDQPR